MSNKTTISKRTDGNLIIHMFHEVDQYPDLSHLEQDYSECSPARQREYKAQDKARLAALYAGEWYMRAVGCEISIKTKQNWAVPTVVGRAYIDGVESDTDEHYFLKLAKDLEAEAWEDMALLQEALKS